MSAIAAELKRRLESDDEPLVKRIKLAENALCHPYVRIPEREKATLQWICERLKNAKTSTETKSLLQSLKHCAGVIHFGILSPEVITGISRALLAVLEHEHFFNPGPNEVSNDILLLDCCRTYIEKCSDHSSFQTIVDEFFNFIKCLLNAFLVKKHSKNEIKPDIKKLSMQDSSIKRILNTLLNCVKNYKKKTIFIKPFIESNLLWTLLKMSENNYFSSTPLNICQTIIFPPSGSAWYKKYFIALIDGNAAQLTEEKGEIVKPIASAVDGILSSPDTNKLSCILKLLMHSYSSDESVIFLFVLIIYKYLGIEQDYIKIADSLTFHKTDINVRQFFLANIKYFSEFNINLNEKHAYSTLDKSKKNLMELMQQSTINLIINNKIDLTTMCIIKEAFLLDPEILKPSMDLFMPNIILCKKDDFYYAYVETMVTIVNVIFKMSKGLELLPSLLSSLKSLIDEKPINKEKATSKDIFPDEFCDQFGKLSSELVPWRHIKMLKLLVESLVELSNEAFENSSDLLLFEAVSLIIIAFHRHSKIADQNMPEMIFVEFNETFNSLENQLLKNIGHIITNKPNVPQLLRPFLSICEAYGHHKLLLWRYQPFYKANHLNDHVDESLHISNIVFLHSYLNHDVWKQIYKIASKDNNTENTNKMNMLILQNHIALKAFTTELEYQHINSNITTKFRKNMLSYSNLSFLLQHDMYLCALLNGLTLSETKILAEHLLTQLMDTKKSMFKGFIVILNTDSLKRQQILISQLVMECIRKVWYEFEDKKKLSGYPSLYKVSDNENFNLKVSLEDVTNCNDFISKMIECDVLSSVEVVASINKLFTLINELPIHSMNENIQHSIIFTIIVLNSVIANMNSGEFDNLQSLQSNMKSILIKLYDVTTKMPNLFEVIPVLTFTSFVKTKFFRLSEDTNGDLFGIIKHIILAICNRNTMSLLLELCECLAQNSALKDDEPNDSLDVFSSEIFQFSSLLLVILNGVKRSSLTSEMKTILNKSQEKISEIFISHINYMKWKTIIAENYLDNIAISNLLEPHSVVFKQHLPKTENEPMKKFSKATNLFIKLSLHILSKENLNLLHAKGSSNFINVILKNYKGIKKTSEIKDQMAFFKNIWNANRSFLTNNRPSSSPEWIEVANTISENTMLVCELCEIKFLNGFLFKELVNIEKFTVENFRNDGAVCNRAPNVMRSMWRCFLHANLKRADKNEVRTSFVKQMTKKIFLWLRSRQRSESNAKPDFEGTIEPPKTASTDEKPDTNTQPDVVACLDIIVEFVQTKKMILSHSLIDYALQIPIEVDPESSDSFYATFEKCAHLLSSILVSRYELLQDRWPCYFISYRRLLGALCSRSDERRDLDDEEIRRLIELGIAVERISQLLIKCAKRDMSRTAAYLIGDVVSQLRGVPVRPSVKFHVQNCANYFFQASDEHSVGFLARNVSDGGRVIFKRMYEEYNKYHKFVGAS